MTPSWWQESSLERFMELTENRLALHKVIDLGRRTRLRLRKYSLIAHLRGLWFARKLTHHGIVVVTGRYPAPTVLNRGGAIDVKNCEFYEGVRLEVYRGGMLTIGNGTYLNRNAVVIAVGNVDIGNDCRIGWDVVIMDSDLHPVDANDQPTESARVVIEDDVWIGCRSIILKGVRIGKRSVIAAGSIVTKDIPPNSIAAGVPARVISSNPERAEFFLKKIRSAPTSR